MADYAGGMKAAAKKESRAIVGSTQDEHNTVALWKLNSTNRVCRSTAAVGHLQGARACTVFGGGAVYSEEHVCCS